MKKLLYKLKQLEKYSRRLPLSHENQDEFLAFCAQKFLEGRRVSTSNFILYVDFIRWHLGRKDNNTLSRHERTDYFIPETPSNIFEAEENMVKRLDAQLAANRVMHFLCQSDQVIIKLIFFDDLSQIEVARILGVSESAMSQRLKNIYYKIKHSKVVENFQSCI